MTSEKTLNDLHDASIAALLAKIKSGEATAADINVARMFLKDNGVGLTNLARNRPMAELADSVLPFPIEETGT